MYFLYNLAILGASFFLKIIAAFNSKLRLFVRGRKETFPYLKSHISATDEFLWIHAASLGEFEQGLPVIEKLRREYPRHKILITFFSPSGYEIKKNTKAADLVCYLPMDTRHNAKEFIATIKPKIAIFIKYEIWPNYLRELERVGVPAVLVSAIFKREQIYFKWYGGFMRRSLAKMKHVFVQNKESEQLLRTIDLKQVTVSGDTRFDRVTEILDRDNTLPFMERFKKERNCLVGGSTWPEDEKILLPFVNNSQEPMVYVLAPHDIKKDHIQDLHKAISKKTVLYSEIKGVNLDEVEVLILDTIGLLTRVYSYADIAYVGGGFATGLHNTLEPAVFAIPVIIGPNYSGFREAEELVQERGIFSVKSAEEFRDLTNLLLNKEAREKAGKINATYINKNKGASVQIIRYIRTLL
ncbi:MAG: 3-deoxy-D-manno-octulosonic acid transferase [Flavobacteriaceae bacterium]